MKPRRAPAPQPRHLQTRPQGMQGFSIVEFMVAIALSLLIVIGASYVYLGSRESQRTLLEKSLTFESARYALDVIGRDIENAGFYPAIRSLTSSATASTVTVESYHNPLGIGAPVAYDAPIFGCQSQRYQPANQVCGNQQAGVDADTLVINYYTNDAAGLNIGNRADCERQDAANNNAINGTANLPAGTTAPMRRNVGHIAGNSDDNPFLVPQRPLFVSNAYTLSAIDPPIEIEGTVINTFSLACNGSGVSVLSNTYGPMISGIDQLRFYFLVGPTTGSQFKRPGAMQASDWQTVTAVRVCLLARSLQPARLQGATPYALTDCDGNNRNFADGVQRRVFSQVFALKNKLQEAY